MSHGQFQHESPKKDTDTVKGRNPPPPGMYKTSMGYLQYQLVQDFFHGQYLALGVCFEMCLKISYLLVTMEDYLTSACGCGCYPKQYGTPKQKNTMGVFTPSLTIGC